jgi:hypothetical protein
MRAACSAGTGGFRRAGLQLALFVTQARRLDAPTGIVHHLPGLIP